MISRLVVKNWKAYASLDVEFSEGATFVVAHNGIGKTSLMEALHFSLFGEIGLGVGLSQARRIGTTETYVEVRINLGGGRTLRIERTITGSASRPISSVRGMLDGAELDGAAVAAAVASEFQADAAQLPMLLMVPDRALDRQINDASNVSVVGHLSRMLGVDRLRDAAATLNRSSQQETKAADAIRIAVVSDTTTSQIVEERKMLTSRREELRARYTRLREQLRALREQQVSLRTWADYRRAVAARSELVEGKVLEFAQLVDGTLGTPAQFTNSSRRVDAVERARDLERAAVDNLASSRSGIEQVERSISLLQQADQVCPTCRRPLSAQDAEHAREELNSELQRLQIEAVTNAEEVEQARRSVRALDSLDREISATPMPAEPSSIEPKVDPTKLSNDISRLEEESEETQRVGADTTSRIDYITQELNRLNESAQQEQQAVSMYRLAEMYKISSATMTGLADALVSEHIEPLSRQLAKRWDDLWSGNPELELTQTGDLQLRRGDHTVGFANFSGGEKTMAVVLLRLLTVQMTTRAGFICFDEPLEHLDVKNRRMLARLLVEASSVGPMRQVIVTTYEESIARALGARGRNTDRARVEYVTASPD